jgi:hypothetical protein
MKHLRSILALFFLFLAVADAWELRMWDKKNYKGRRIWRHMGVGDRHCNNMSGASRNRADSVKWDKNAPCRITFWDKEKCKGDFFLRTNLWTVWNKRDLGAKKNKISSYKIECDR